MHAPGTIFDAETIAAGIEHLSQRDALMARLVERFPPEPRPRPESIYGNLCRSVCSQLLSNAAATAIFGRLRDSCGGIPTPEAVGTLEDDELRACGISRSKVACLRAITAYWESENSIFGALDDHGDKQIRAALVDIKGLGHWTADMFLLFSLGRTDIFSVRDAALTNGVLRLKGLPKETPRIRLEAIARRWSPYRSVASLTLYQWRHAGYADVQPAEVVSVH